MNESMITIKHSDNPKIIDSICHPDDVGRDFITSNNCYDWYYTFGHHIKPTSILEVGVRYGYSLISILNGTINAGIIPNLVVGTDLEFFKNSNDIANNNIRKIFENVYDELNIKLYSKSLEDLYNNDQLFSNLKFDFIHQDAAHNEHIKTQIEICFNMLNPGGYLIIDDMTSHESVKKSGSCKIGYNIMKTYVVEELLYKNKAVYYTHLNSLRGTYVIRRHE